MHRLLGLEGTLDIISSNVSLSARILSTTSLGKDEEALNTPSDSNLTTVQANLFYCCTPSNIRELFLILRTNLLLFSPIGLSTSTYSRTN